MAKITKSKQKSNKIGKILLASGSAAIVAVGGVTVALKHEDIKSWFNHNKSYSYEEVQDLIDKNNDSWNAKVEYLTNNSNVWKSQIAELTQAKSASDVKIAELESKLSTEQTKYKALEAELEATKADHAKELEDLKSQHAREIAALKTELESEKNNNNSLTSDIEELTQKLADADQKIQMYEQIIQQYENNETAPVSYYDGDDLILATLVSKGSTFSLDSARNPVNTETRQFVGYGIDGELVDDKSNVINSATVYHAMFNYKITYIVNGVESSHFIFENNTIDSNAPDTTASQNQEFSHWEDSDGNTIDLSEIKATKSMTVIAVFDEVYNITFNYNNTSKTIRLVNGALSEELPTVTVATDYGHYGWIDSNGNYISNNNLTSVTSDITVTPNIVQMKKAKIKYRTSSSGSYTEYSKYCYASPSIDSIGKVSAYYISSTMTDFKTLITEIETATGKKATGKCYSLVESQTAYLSSIGMTNIGTGLEDYYIYVTLS